jgi:hypothetical protein
MQTLQVAAQAATEGATGVSLLPAMDLSRFIARVRRENPDWTEQRLVDAERGYREFLLECKSIPNHRPSRDVDKIWHAHILHTREYIRDTQAYLGYYLHHTPDNGGKAKAGDCQGGGDGCTACSSGCSGGGTVKTTSTLC